MKPAYLAFLFFLVLSSPSFGFDINPYKKYDGSRELVAGSEKLNALLTSIIIHPVHEELTVKTLYYLRDAKLPGLQLIEEKLIESAIRGVRWNDDPLHLLPDYPKDWLLNFEHASDLAPRLTNNFDLFYRSHHHDLQFLHAMAASDNEPARETQTKVLAWVEFTYKVATGYLPIHTHFRNLSGFLTPQSSRIFRKYFTQNGRRLNWTPAYLFALKCRRPVSPPDQYAGLDCSQTDWHPEKNHIQNVALGSLLHLLQDSFSDSHVTRRPQYDGQYSLIHGRSAIDTFNAYAKQSINLHRGADAYPKDFDTSFSQEGYNLEKISAEVVSNLLVDRNRSRRHNRWHLVITGLKNGLFKLNYKQAIAGSGKYK